MRLDALFARDCVQCPTSPPVCSCDTSSQDCLIINRSCDACSHFQCVAKGQSNNNGTQVSGGGVSKGALAGAVVGTLIFLGIVIGLFFLYRRNNRLLKKNGAAREVKPDVPAAAEDVLNRPDPMEKTNSVHRPNTVRVYSNSNTTIDLDPESQASSHHTAQRTSVRSNPFDDNHSIQTAGTEGTNVIPIALVSPETHSTISHQSDASRAASPARPPRSPELNLDHVNVSHDSLRSPKAGYALSQRSGLSGVSSNRQSYMSNASYSSDFLNEAPMIMTANKVVINGPDGLKPPTSRPMVTSPLAATSFGPTDVLREVDESTEDGHNPFSDKHSSTRTTLATSNPASPRSVTTFGQPSPAPNKVTHLSVQSDWEPESPSTPWARSSDSSRPSSISTQAGSVIDIASATRVNLGLASPQTAISYRTTMGRLVTPLPNDKGTFEEQQQRAIAHAQAQAQAQGLDKSRRTSGSSAISTTADSILESFPFVPPSPISNRPVRSPPISPLAKQSFSPEPSTPVPQQKSSPDAVTTAREADLPSPPNRRTLGLSTASQLSTASSGLGSFPFQIDTGSSGETSPAPSGVTGRQRASLDTLALTSDLSSYPLGFDRDSQMPPLRKN